MGAYFINLSKVISRTLFLSIAKLHQGILLNYQTFQFEAGLISLTGSYSQMVLSLDTKDNVMEEARRLHQMRENVKIAYTDYLSLSNPNLLSFLRTVIPQISFSHTFDYENFKSDLLNGSFGNIFHYQSNPLPLSCPQIKAMSEDLYEKIAKISSFKATEDQIQKKLSCNLKENLKLQCDRWAANKTSSPQDISYLEVQLETLKSLKKEALSLSTKVEWTPSSLGISQLDLEQIIVEISQTLQETKRSDRQKESKDKKICDQISSQGPPLALPKIHSPTDILVWMKVYKQVNKFVYFHPDQYI